jgi:hypothetical protein
MVEVIAMSARIRKSLSVISLVVLTLLLPIGAAAYTVVLRSGERRQIPDNFRVTRAGITYATAPRIEVTILMTVINVPATDSANREPAGSLLGRINVEPAPAVAPAAAPALAVRQPQSTATSNRKLVTNAELERYRRDRENNEAAFDQRQTQSGQPTLAELRKRAAESDTRMAQQADSAYENRARAESYWRGQAQPLRDSLVDLDAQILATRVQLWSTPIVSLRAPQVDLYGFPIYSGRNLGTDPGVDSYLRARLLRDLNRLEQQRLVLRYRWNTLEEDARRSGVPPGWLRRY